MTTTILGLATAAPPAVPQSDAAAMARQRCCTTPQQARLLQTLYRQSTVAARGSVLLSANGNGHAAPDRVRHRIESFYDPPDGEAPRGPTVATRMQRYAQRAPQLAATAARAALDRSGVPASAIAQLVVVSCTGFRSPGVDLALMDALDLPPTVGRTIIGFMGCHGAINGLRIVDALASSRPGEPALLCAVELCSLHFQYGWNPQQIVANALFADGAAAIVGISADTAPTQPRLVATGSFLIPQTQNDMTWTIGDHGFEMTLSPRVPALIQQNLRPWLTRWLADHGVAPADVGSWAIHPGGPRLLDAVEVALSLPPQATAASRHVLTERGNMSSPTILFILERLQHQRAPMPCVALAFGPGLVAEAALFA